MRHWLPMSCFTPDSCWTCSLGIFLCESLQYIYLILYPRPSCLKSSAVSIWEMFPSVGIFFEMLGSECGHTVLWVFRSFLPLALLQNTHLTANGFLQLVPSLCDLWNDCAVLPTTMSFGELSVGKSHTGFQVLTLSCLSCFSVLG